MTNTIPVIFGAMGTPVWFGMSLLSLPEATITDIAKLAALISTLVAPVIVFLALRLVLPSWQAIFRHWLFILSSTFACTLPFLALSFFGVEFPSLLGGGIGLIVTVIMAKAGFGLSSTSDVETKSDAEHELAESPNYRAIVKASFPLWGTVIILLLTRLPELGLRSLLQDGEPNITASLGILGNVSVSASLVISLADILETGILTCSNRFTQPVKG